MSLFGNLMTELWNNIKGKMKSNFIISSTSSNQWSVFLFWKCKTYIKIENSHILSIASDSAQ